MYLHFEYLLINRGSSFNVNIDLSILKYTKNREEVILQFDQIGKIVLYLPPSAFGGLILRKMQFLPVEAYGYAVIYSNEGDKFVVTSLLVPDVYKEFEKINGIQMDKKKRVFASPSVEPIIQWFKKDGL